MDIGQPSSASAVWQRSLYSRGLQQHCSTLMHKLQFLWFLMQHAASPCCTSADLMLQWSDPGQWTPLDPRYLHIFRSDHHHFIILNNQQHSRNSVQHSRLDWSTWWILHVSDQYSILQSVLFNLMLTICWIKFKSDVFIYCFWERLYKMSKLKCWCPCLRHQPVQWLRLRSQATQVIDLRDLSWASVRG